MSIKDFFKTGEKAVISSPIKSLDDLGREVESSEYIPSYLEDKDRFVPHVDFSSASNFARYGSAQQYYEDTIKRVYNTYPYDGSEREKIDWHNDSTYIDQYIFDYRYPRTTGYAILSAGGWGTLQGSLIGGYGAPASTEYEYIQIKGGPNTDTDATSTAKLFPGLHEGKANIFDANSNQKSNLALNSENGFSVEFWLKKDSFTTTNTEKEVIFDLWNGENSSSVGYGRLTIELTGAVSGSPFLVTAQSGTKGFYQQSIGSTPTTSSISDWTHYAFTFLSSSTDLETKFYVNGDLEETLKTGTPIDEITGSLIANIGALRAPPSASLTNTADYSSIVQGYGKLSGSIDEFRYWTEKRTSKDIGRNWWTQVGGGTNTDVGLSGTYENKFNDQNLVNLGVYYKFNEGITLSSSTDSTVLDYSGRVSNGTWTGYVDSSSRSTGSAMVLSNAASSEFKDPIIYYYHPKVSDLLNDLKGEGKTYDEQNNASIYNSLPGWITEEDSRTGGGVTKKLTQIVGSYFDSLHLQIENLPKLKDADYLSASFKPLPFTDKLLHNRGFAAPDILNQTTDLELLANRSDDFKFKQKLYDIKNNIYKNIYNNLAYIYKSKGTEKSFRNLFRCYGVDDELIRLNLYADNVAHTIRDNYRSTSHRKKYIAFNHPDRFGATVFQSTSSANPNSTLSYISGSDTANLSTTKEFWIPWTIETEVIFPKKVEAGSDGFYITSFLSSSLFGCHEAGETVGEFTWASGDNNNFQVYAVRDEEESTNTKFVLSSSLEGWPTIESGVYEDVYENNKWNFAVRFYVDKTNNYGLQKGGVGDLVDSSDQDVTPYIELYGVNSVLDHVVHEFSVSGTLTLDGGVDPLHTANKRIYIGAHRTNFTGSVITPADTKISSVRYWTNYLSNETIKAHARDASNFGTEHPYRNVALMATSLSGVYLPSMESLALHWDFNNLTGSDSNGEFSIQDYSSGSVSETSRYDWYGNVAKNQHVGHGLFFPASSTDVVSNEFVHSAKQRLPESLDSADLVNILSRDDELINFTREKRPINHFFAIEKSMYQTISEEMINFFATVVDFNNLIGEPVNRYRQSYKEMGKIRQLFYERVRNTPNLEKYINFYKWIDSAISEMIIQLIPASANMSDKLRNVVESHVLERNKYWTKYPTLEFAKPEPEAGLHGIAELSYNWKRGHAPYGDGVSPDGIVMSDDFSSGDLPAADWTTNRASVKAKYDHTANLYAVVLSGSVNESEEGSEGDDRWIQTNRKFLGPLRVSYQFIEGTISPKYDANGLDLDKPESDDNMFLQYSIDNTNWVTVAEHGGQGATTTDTTYVGGKWRTFETQIPVHNHVYIRWFQDHYNIGAGTYVSRDHWAITDVIIRGYSESDNCLWWSEKAEASNSVITSGDATIDSQRFVINSATKHRSGSAPNLATSGASGLSSYDGSTYAINRFSKPYRFTVNTSRDLHGGPNYHRAKNLDYVHIATEPFGPRIIIPAPHSEMSNLTASVNYLMVQSAEVDAFKGCSDVIVPNDKRKYRFNVINSRESEAAAGYSTSKGEYSLPFNVQSSSVGTGYARELIDSQFGINLAGRIDFTNIHHDAYGPNNETPMQSPFTEKFVGGRQHRHVDLNKHNPALVNNNNNLQQQSERPEAWFIFAGDADGNFALVGPTYSTTDEYDKDTPRATRMREDFAKRPINIRNIQQTTVVSGTSIGNYEKNWNVVNTTGRTQNSAYFKENGGVSLPSAYEAALPTTTHVHTLVAVRSHAPGNEVGNTFSPPSSKSNSLNINSISNRFSLDESRRTIFTLPRLDLTGSDSVIVNRFSAPGGPEVMSRGYLDVKAEEYSVHNALPFRNLTVRGSGSGEQNTIRMSIVGSLSRHSVKDREGLRTRLTRHCGIRGFDSQWGDPEASFHKVNRNPRKRIKESS